MADANLERIMQQGEALRNAFHQYQLGAEEVEQFAELTRSLRRCLEEQAEIDRQYRNRQRMEDTFRQCRQRMDRRNIHRADNLLLLLLLRSSGAMFVLLLLLWKRRKIRPSSI